MKQLLHILRYKLFSGVKLKMEPKLNVLVKNFASMLVFGGFAVGAFFFSYNVTSYLIEELRIGQFLLHRFLSMGLFVFFITISLGNILVSYSTLFKSPEVNFLLTNPVSFFKIFLIKFLDNFFYSSTTFFIMGFAVIAGYGAYYSHPWYFYPLIMFGIFIPFMFLAACIAVIILLGVLRLTEFISIKHLAFIAIIGYLAVVAAFFQGVSPIALVNSVLEQYPDIDQYFTDFDPWFLKYLPSHWVAELLYWASQGNFQKIMINGIQLLLSVGGVFGMAVIVGRKNYYRAWTLTIGLRDTRPFNRRKGVSGLINMTSASVLPRAFSVILKRDFIRFLRDPGQWVHFVLIMLLVSVFIVSVRSLEVELFDPFLLTIIYLVLFMFNAFLVSAIALRFIYPMVSLEGEALWAVRSAPFNISRTYYLKAAGAVFFLGAIALTLTYITVNSVYSDSSLMMFSAGGQVMVVLSVVGLNLGLGSYFADYNERNPIRIASSQGASLTFLIVLLYLLLVVSTYVPFIIRFFEQSVITGSTRPAWVLTPLFMHFALSFFLSGTAMILGVKALKSDV